MIRAAYLATSLLLTLPFVSPAIAQEGPISDTDVVTSCMVAAGGGNDGCLVIMNQLIAQLAELGLTPAEIDQRLVDVTTAVAEAAAAADLSPAASVLIGEGLRVAAAGVSDVELQDSIIEVAEAEEAGDDFETADIEVLGSNN